jgi:hypothetical protein
VLGLGTVAPFLRYVQSAGFSPDQVLAVIASEAEAADYLADLAGAACACVEPQGGPLGNAFQINAFPSFFLLAEHGVIIASAFDPGALPEPVAA